MTQNKVKVKQVDPDGRSWTYQLGEDVSPATQLPPERLAFKKRIEPKMQVILKKLKEIEGLKRYRKSLRGGVTQEDIAHVASEFGCALDEAIQTLIFLRDYTGEDEKDETANDFKL